MTVLCRATWAFLALAFLPQFASAGPVRWSYQTEVQYDADYGPRFAVALAANGTATTASGEPTYLALFTSTVNPHPLPGEFETRYGFTVAVTISDEASGTSRSVSFPGWYSSMWSYQAEEANNRDSWRWDWEMSNFGDYREGYDFDLGGNLYTVRGYGGGNGTYPFGKLAVTVQPAVSTPEPGTLALSGLGLAAVGLIRARRRDNR